MKKNYLKQLTKEKIMERDNVFEEFDLDPSDPDSIDKLIDICNPEEDEDE